MSTLPKLLQSTAKLLKLEAGAAAISSGQSLGIEVPHQDQDNWCWCAITVGVSSFYDPTFGLSQCQTAARVLSIADACSDPENERVNRMFDLDKSLAVFGRFNQIVNGPLSFSLVMREIDAQRPVGVRILFLDSGKGHFTVIRGYRREPQQMLLIDDPLYDEFEITYKNFLTDYQGNGRWKQTYLTQ